MKHFRFLLLTAILVFFFFIPQEIEAFSFYSSTSQKFDSSLIETSSQTYSNPTKIYISQITTQAQSLSRDSSKWVNALYYYSVTRLHLPDLPYMYLLDENGIIYQGKEGNIGSDSGIKDAEGAIVIGYLSNNSILTSRAESSLYEMVDEISKQWGISEIESVKLKISKNEQSQSVLSYSLTTGELSNSIKELFKQWKGYKEEDIEYNANIEKVEYNKELEVGQRGKVTVTVKNMNDFVWFTDKDPIYISVASGKDSNFAVNQVWQSFTRPVSISDRNILPGESILLEFEMEARMKLGEAKESFVLLKYNDKPFESSAFDVVLNIVKGDKIVVQTVSPRYGFVNIRECKWTSCKIIDTVDEGSMFILLEEQEGWSKIKYGEVEGWIAPGYLKKV